VTWRRVHIARQEQQVAGPMPADAPQALIAAEITPAEVTPAEITPAEITPAEITPAEITIVREATHNTFAIADAPGLTAEEARRVLRTAVALTIAGLAVERVMVQCPQIPVPFFSAVLADGIDIAAIAARWGGPGPGCDGGKTPGGSPPLENSASGNRDKDPMEQGTGRAGSVQGGGVTGAGACPADLATGKHDKDPVERGTGREGLFMAAVRPGPARTSQTAEPEIATKTLWIGGMERAGPVYGGRCGRRRCASRRPRNWKSRQRPYGAGGGAREAGAR